MISKINLFKKVDIDCYMQCCENMSQIYKDKTKDKTGPYIPPCQPIRDEFIKREE